MSKRNGAGQSLPVGLSTSKCKRMVRPLLSKIHSLNDLYYKYPALLEINFQINPYLMKYDYTKPSPFSMPTRVNKPRKRKRTHSDYGDLSDEEYGPVTIENKTPDPTNMENECLAIIKPKDSFQRLKSLQTFISSELYDSYCEIFQIFRNIISSSLLNHKNNRTQVSSLSSLCSMSLGKSIALTTKSTYYKVNQSMLFDAATMPPEIRFHQEELFDDVDSWLEMEPTIIFNNYREDLFIGYIVYLLIFHQKLLYLLIPVLLHWLKEEAINSPEKKTLLNRTKNLLFEKYWNNNDKLFNNSMEENVILMLNGSILDNSDTKGFWALHKIGYFQELINMIDIKTSHNNYSTYDDLFLQAVDSKGRINFELFSSLDLEDSDESWFLTKIYSVFKRCPQHPSLNSILVNILTQITSMGRLKLSTFQYSHQILPHFTDTFELLFDFLNQWLGFRPQNIMVFNSLYYGNSDMFGVILQFCYFVNSKCLQIQKKLLHNSTDDDSLSNMINDYDDFIEWINTLISVVHIYEAYFLDESDINFNLNHNSPRVVAELLLAIQNRSDLKNKLDAESYRHFLYWLVKKDNNELARECFKNYYGKSLWFDNDTIDDIRYFLFEEII
ncbi:hypothetical protein DFJ63DRAFT_337698 [Scheffersomyces coipomensis]|uniref:uncharacterized protein n=1 Tax=Scheffersomyces coipomensis TaxID=1788519 RepID=UPI00315D50AB